VTDGGLEERRGREDSSVDDSVEGGISSTGTSTGASSEGSAAWASENKCSLKGKRNSKWGMVERVKVKIRNQMNE
jgi:hypothetical protein